MASDVDHVGDGGDDIFELMVMIIRMIRSDGKKVGSDDDDDIYIMVKCLFVCHEKSSLPPGSLL